MSTGSQRRNLVAFSLMVSLIYMLPNLLFLFSLGKQYRGLSLPLGYDQETYFAMIREVYDGNYGLESPYLWEEKHGRRDFPDFVSYSQIQSLPIYVSGYIGKSLNLDMGALDILLKGLFPPIIFLLLYFLARSLETPPGASMLAALMGTLMPQIWSGVAWIFPTWVPWNHHLIFMRPVVSQVSVLPWVAALIFLVRAIKLNNLTSSVLSGTFLGIVFYCYMFYWVYTYIVIGVFLLLALLLGERSKIKYVLVVLGTSVMISVPVWLQYMKSLKHLRADPEQGFTMYGDRTPYVTEFEVAILLFLVILMITYRRGWLGKTRTSVLGSLAGAHILCMNQQVFIGKGMESSHYEMFISPVIFSVVLVSFVSGLLSNERAVYELSQVFETPNWRKCRRFGLVALGVALAAAAGVWSSTEKLAGTAGGVLGSALRAYGRSAGIVFSILAGGSIAIWGTANLWSVALRRRYVVLGIVMVWGVGTQLRHYAYMTETDVWVRAQSLMPAFRWLDQWTGRESVVLGNFTHTAMWIPIYTHDNVYTAHYAKVTTSSVAAFHERTLRYLSFLGMSEKELRESVDNRLAQYDRGLQLIFFGWRQFERRGKPKLLAHGLYVPSLTDADIDRLADRYREILKEDPLGALAKYRVDYIFDGPFEHDGNYRYRRPLSTYGTLRAVYHDSVVTIYKVERQE